MKVAVHQPNYIPWCGYFAKMKACDVFVFLDDAEMSTGQSYVYRSQIRDREKVLWLSIPNHRSLGKLICDVHCVDNKWPVKHLNILKALYGKKPFFDEVYNLIEPCYKETEILLAIFNIRMIKTIARYLNISCRFELSSELQPSGTRDARHISLVKILNGDVYLSGKGGAVYQDPTKFQEAGIQLEILEYIPIPYPQFENSFISGLSILDALFNLGNKASDLLVY